MNDFNIVITRCTFTAGLDGNSPRKIIGFTVQNPDASKQIYHETILQHNQFEGKNDEECVDIAFGILSSSIADSANQIKTVSTVIGSLYIPS